jgi:hypothetical protein
MQDFYLTIVRFYDMILEVVNGEVCMELTLSCDHCGDQFVGKTSWARFCSLRCRNAWWRHQYKLAEVQAQEDKRALNGGEVNGLRARVDGNAIVEAIKSAVAPVVEEPMKRRALT